MFNNASYGLLGCGMADIGGMILLFGESGGVSQMGMGRSPQEQIDGFIKNLVMDRGSDKRTAKAYRSDLELFFRWLGFPEGDVYQSEGQGKEETMGKERSVAGKSEADRSTLEGGRLGHDLERAMESYLDQLFDEKGLRFSTISRKHRVFGYYLSYLQDQGILKDIRPLMLPEQLEKSPADNSLTKKEVDSFFRAIDREYMELDSDFRRRVCLRDQVMMELLFYHRIEISELLRLEMSDYDKETAVLKIRRKRERDRTVHLFSPALQEQMIRWLQEHVYFEHGELYQERMFLSKLGKPLSMKMVTNIFEKYRVLAGIEKECTPKDLKNGLGRYAEEVVREKWSSRDVQRLPYLESWGRT